MNKLYIFDFDGMLVDTIHDSIACLNQALNEFGKPIFEEDLNSFVYEDLRQFLRDNSSSKDTPVYPRYIELCNESDFSTTKAYDGMIDVLKELENRNISLAQKFCIQRGASYFFVHVFTYKAHILTHQ